MGCLRINRDTYKGKIIKMGDNKNSIDYEKLAEEIVKQQGKDKKSKSVWEIVKRVGSVLAVFGTVVVVTLYFSDKFAAINQSISGLETQVSSVHDRIDGVQTQINEMQTEIESINTEIAGISDYLYKDEGVQDQLGIINEALNIRVINITNENAVSYIEDVTIEGNDVSYTTSSMPTEMIIGADINNNEYSTKDLVGERVILTYTDNGKTVVFLGQLNEKYHWEGYCVTNTYNADGTLYGICESNFSDGKRLDYKTVLAGKGNKWDYYNRVCIENESGNKANIGTSTTYKFVYSIKKNFTNTNVRISDILFADKFLEKQHKVMLQYYSGCTSDGQYNDDSGLAYLIKFDEDETVRMLYVGQFVDGELEDHSGNAWNIAYWESGHGYVCNTGKFSNNTALEHSNEKITQEEIDEKLKGIKIPFDLKWKVVY